MTDQIVTIDSRAGSAQAIVKDPLEFIQSWWLNKGEFYETRLLEYIYWHYKGRVFVDVGSNAGNHTLFFAKFCEAQHVISVEPVAGAVAFQRELLALNKLQQRVTIHECAVSDYQGRGEMRLWEKKPVFYQTCGQLHPGDEVDVTTLDVLLADVEHLNLIKIDVEMREMAVLRGAQQVLSQLKPSLFVEIRNKPSYYEVKELLASHGYRQVGSHFQEGQVFEFTVHADETETSHLA